MIHLEGLEGTIELEDTFTSEYQLNDALYRFTIESLKIETKNLETESGYWPFVDAEAKWKMEKIKITEKKEKRHNPPINEVKEESVIWSVEGKYHMLGWDERNNTQKPSNYRDHLILDARKSNIFISKQLIEKLLPATFDSEILNVVSKIKNFTDQENNKK
ncbi:hypothetical protein HY837_05860 [archaeon]|nr:hypothetical protein [archaeon]